MPAWQKLVVRQHDRAEYDHIKPNYEELVTNPDQPHNFVEENSAMPVLLLCLFTIDEGRRIRTALDERGKSYHESNTRCVINP